MHAESKECHSLWYYSPHLTQRSFLVPSNSSMWLQIHGNIGINLVIPKVIFLHEWIIKAVLIVSSGGGADGGGNEFT